MNTYPLITRWAMALALLFGGILLGGWGVQALSRIAAPAALGTGFSYQGRLADAVGDPIDNVCTLTFGLYDADSGGNQIGNDDAITGVTVENGLFTVTLNETNEFGDEAFNGQPRWLEISVQCTGDGSATVLGRQPINPVPYALFAERFAGYENVIVVAKSNGDFDSVAEAVNAIGVDPRYPAASSSNRYLIYIAPGVYDDDQVVLQPFVDLEGAGQGLTFLRYPAVAGVHSTPAAVLVGTNDSEVRHLTVENTTASGVSTAAIGIYLDTSATFSLQDVTVRAMGGEEASGIFIAGTPAVLIAKDVVVDVSSDGTDSTGVALFNGGTLQANNLNIFVGGATEFNIGISALSPDSILITGAQITVIGSGLLDDGIHIQDADDVVLELVTLNLSNVNSEMRGIFLFSSNSVVFRNSQLTLIGTAAPVSGILGIDSSFEVVESRIFVSNTSMVQGVSSTAATAGNYEVKLLRSSVLVDNSEGPAVGLRLFSNDPSIAIDGSVIESQISLISTGLVGIKYGIQQSGIGYFTYRDVSVMVDGGPTDDASFGMHVLDGVAELNFVDIEASAAGDNSVTGLHIDGTGQVFANFVNAGASHTNGHDAIGVQVDSNQGHVLRDVNSVAVGDRDAAAFVLQGGNYSAANLTAFAVNVVEGGVGEGLQCGNGAIDGVVVNLDGAQITVISPEDTLASSSGIGISGEGCKLRLTNASVLVDGFGSANFGMFMEFTSGVEVLNSSIRVAGEMNPNGQGANYGVYLYIAENNWFSGTTIEANVDTAGEQTGLVSETFALGGQNNVYLRNSTVFGYDNVAVLMNNSFMDVYSSTLEYGAIIVGPGSFAQCTGVTRTFGLVPFFVAGPGMCP